MNTSNPKVAVIVFPGTNSEEETVDACRDAGMDAQFFWWSEDPATLRGFDAYVLPGGFAHEDRVRAGAIAAKSPAVEIVREEAARGKLVLGLCNGAQMLAESGMLGEVAIARNLPAGHFQCRIVDVAVDKTPDRCAFTRGLQPGTVLRMAMAHGEGRFTGEERVLEELENAGRIVLRYAHDAPNSSAHRAAGVCNSEGNVLAIMPHPERVAWAFNNVAFGVEHRVGDPNRAVGAHVLFDRMAKAIGRSRRIAW